MTSKWPERIRIRLPCGRNLWKTFILMNPHHFLITFFLGCTWRECKTYEIIFEEYTKMFESRISAGATERYQGGKSLTPKQSRGSTTWKDMLENAFRDVVRWHTKKPSSKTQFQVLAWMITNSRRKNLNQLENYPKYAHKLPWSACTWHEFVDQTFLGLSTNLQEQTQNILFLAIDVRQDWFHTFITQMTADNIVMWATRLSIVDWVCSKTQALLETLRIQNQLREESCVSLEAEHLSPFVGCVRNKRQYPTVLLNLKSSRWTTNGWTTCSRPLGCGNWGGAFDNQHNKTNWTSFRKLLRDRNPFEQ